ncbi:MAG: HAD domain-containing protein [Gammaproteobacteria bacterium]|nr:HAD domain-containing protein [Gammaproteobacteria bacterium]MCY4227077.1 HAD domain-containing protein [Gammaproteobacteria bacterium]
MKQESEAPAVIFLDIDGVLQPYSSQKRFDHDLHELLKTLAEKYDDDLYLELDRFDLGCICFDWDIGAVERIRSICEDLEAKIVVSSDWRRGKSVEALKAYFRIHGLHYYVKDKTDNRKWRDKAPEHSRAGEVKEYLDAHPEIERFVIIDDGYRDEFEKLYPEQFVHTRSRMNFDNEVRARQILSGQPPQPNEPGAPSFFGL